MPKCHIEITLRPWCSPVNLQHIFRTHLLKNTSEWMFLNLSNVIDYQSLKETQINTARLVNFHLDRKTLFKIHF